MDRLVSGVGGGCAHDSVCVEYQRYVLCWMYTALHVCREREGFGPLGPCTVGTSAMFEAVDIVRDGHHRME